MGYQLDKEAVARFRIPGCETSAPGLESDAADAGSTYAQFARPLPARLMEALKLDKRYVRACGDYLFYCDGESEVPVLDLAGGYGSLILGHNHPELVRLAQELLGAGVPVHAQMSVRSQAGTLAREISDEIGRVTGKRYTVTLANSGAEAVEAAAKHARMAYYERLDAFFEQVRRNLAQVRVGLAEAAAEGRTLRLAFDGKEFRTFDAFRDALIGHNQAAAERAGIRFLAADRAFHGKSLAALALTHRHLFREPFLRGDSDTRFFAWDEAGLDRLFEESRFTLWLPLPPQGDTVPLREEGFCAIAAVFVEPIQGEAGALPVPPTPLRHLAGLARAVGVPLIFDEIQSGCFRTGDFLASAALGVEADYYLLGKSLGGGLVKLSALAVAADHYRERFGLLHTSTFTEDDFSAAVARKALVLAREQAGQVRRVGERLMAGLQALAARYPEVITEVTGRGLMLAVRFADFCLRQSYGLQFLARSGYLGYLLAGYLLNRHRVRIAPPLAAKTAIRLQPSAFIDDAAIDRTLSALDQLCRILRAEDLYKLVEFALPAAWQGLREPGDFRLGDVVLEPPPPGARTVGFLTHYIDATRLREADPSLALLDDATVEDLLTRMLPVAEPIVLGRRTIRSADGQPVSMVFAGICATSRMIREALQQKSSDPFRQLCHRGVELLSREMGAAVVGLGQYTSILTANGLSLPELDARVTTGNSFTVHIGVEAVLAEAADHFPAETALVVGVIGAGGNICSAYAQSFVRHAAQMHLVGSSGPHGPRKAHRAAATLLGEVVAHLRGGGTPRSALERALAASATVRAALAAAAPRPSTELWRLLEEELGATSPLRVHPDLTAMKGCNVVVVATNSSEPFLLPEHFAPNTIVYDISVPMNCRPELLDNDQGIRVLLGGVVALPGGESLPLRGFPLEEGLAYACMSDTLLLGLEPEQPSCSYGAIRSHHIDTMGRLGAKHGFHFAKTKSDQIF